MAYYYTDYDGCPCSEVGTDPRVIPYRCPEHQTLARVVDGFWARRVERVPYLLGHDCGEAA